MKIDLDRLASAIAKVDDGHPLHRFPLGTLREALEAAKAAPTLDSVDAALAAVEGLGAEAIGAVSRLRDLRARAERHAALRACVVTK